MSPGTATDDCGWLIPKRASAQFARPAHLGEHLAGLAFTGCRKLPRFGQPARGLPVPSVSAWVIPSTRIQDATSGSSQRASNTLMALPGGLHRCPATSPDPDGQPAGGVAYGVAYGPHNGPIPAVLSLSVVRLGHTSVFQDRSIRPLWHLSAARCVRSTEVYSRSGRSERPRSRWAFPGSRRARNGRRVGSRRCG